MSIPPSVRAELVERFILNVRMPPDAMRTFLPVDWLRPAEIKGHAVASFCLLDLRNITVAPLATIAGLRSVSCAPRYAVLDASVSPPEPAVYVTERFTSSTFGSWFTGLGFSAPHPRIDATIRRDGAEVELTERLPNGALLFHARLRAAAGTTSVLFDADAFAGFIAQGVSSYGRSRHGSRLTKLDLHKDDRTYEPMDVLDMGGSAVEPWLRAGGELDSAFRTAGGRYEWTYYGLTP